ncbi:SpoIIE family protein phosphatase [Streptomyces sp. NPDC047108]|uniref:SpoIIE family protein phosphatase n=1 Tax=Streptomyces sp. NPDC047108 TaxID=3155025 RepID=UPI0033D9FB4D
MDADDATPRERLPSHPNPYHAAIMVDRRGAVTGWSPGARRLLGHASDAVMGRPLSDLLVSGASSSFSAVKDGWRGDLDLRHANGHRLRLPVRVSDFARHGAGTEQILLLGDPGGGTPVDEHALLEWLFTDSPVALTVYDTELRCVRQNEAMSRVMGVTQEERMGRRVEDVLFGPDTQAWEDRMRDVMVSGEAAVGFRIRGRTRADPDHDHVFSADASVLRDAAGRVLGVCATVGDVTAQHLARERLAVLNEASLCIGSTLDVPTTAQELADIAVPGVADFASVDLLEPLLHGDEPGPATGGAELRRMAHRSVNEGAPETVVDIGDVGVYPYRAPPVRCLTAPRPMVLETTDPLVVQWFEDDPPRAERAERYGFHSFMLAPIRARGVTLGVTMLIRSGSREPFREEDVVLAEELVRRAGICLDNARRYTREHTTALALQRSLLPQELPRQPALDIAFRYLPADSQFGVGGDWFDVIPLSGARVALAVGDVAGHGLHASATMGRLRTAVRTLADVDLPPDELLTHLDDLVTHLGAGEDAEAGPETGGAQISGHWATCLYAIYDPVTRMCSFACAGHPPPAVLSPDGQVDFVPVTPGPPLGLGGLPFESREMEMPEDSVLALYTDGLLGSRGDDLDEGLDHLRTVLTKPANSLDSLCNTVVDAMIPDRAADDAALLMARTHALHADRVAVKDLPMDPAALADTRTWALEQLERWGLEDAGFVTELVVSELVTNALRYGAPPIQLRLIKESSLICEVSDGSSTAPHLRRAPVLDEGGRGLLLVAQLTDRWGTRPSQGGKTIWCEQPLPEGGETVTGALGAWFGESGYDAGETY